MSSDGLAADDLVITEGVQTLREGSEVSVVEQEVSAVATGSEKL